MAKRSPLHELTESAGATFHESAGWLMPMTYRPEEMQRRADAFEAGALLVDGSNRGKIEVTGKDAASFLHNLCTNDIAGMPLGAGCEAFFCNARAKVLGHALIYHARTADGASAYWLDVAPGQAEPLIQHLNRFHIAEDVEIIDRTDEFAQLHLAGSGATAVLSRALADEVPDLDHLLHMERTFGVNVTAHIRRNDVLGKLGYDLVTRNEVAAGLWRMLAGAGAVPEGDAMYSTYRFMAGMPVYGVDIDENRFAFEIGRTAQAISYNKGCYLGQEPIVMSRDRAGHAPRMLTGLLIPQSDGQQSFAGTKLRRNGEEVGWITSSILSPKHGHAVAMGYLRHGHHEPGTEVEAALGDATYPAIVQSFPF